ncbi:lytic transglycosylase domain-containing protein [Methylopila sp. M107]|uniref:lytic transglycosylase domain-containing protein n=1 Tax=Methylopila sp. M107 TaxID=1101190 RepID=UPI000372B910|nr:lytic transglycosylase domain-containing protein [Methylopila sp. M107]
MQLTSPADGAGRVTDALKSAAQATGAGFDYLMRTAKRESALNPAAQNSASSARGLFQFIDSTWLEVLKEEGAKLGLGDAAASVQKTASGRYTVQDPAKKAELLALRDDPQASALLAGAFTRRNADRLTNALGRAPSEGELYAAHFLGAGGAAQLVSLASASPDASAAAAFPSQAAANRAIFFDKGRARSAGEVYEKLTAVAAATASVPSIATTASLAATPASRVAKVEAPEPAYNGGVENDQAPFHSLFSTGRRSPVSAYVAQAWSAFGEAGMVADVASAKTAATIAPAYAPEVRQTASAVAATQAVNRAATTKPRRVVATLAPPPALAAATPALADKTVSAAKPAGKTAVATEKPAAAAVVAAPVAERPNGLLSFLKSVLSPPASAAPASASTRIGAPR